MRVSHKIKYALRDSILFWLRGIPLALS